MYRFTHSNAYSWDEAVALTKGKKAAVIAGGTDLLTVMKGMCIPEEVAPEVLVNIKTIPGANSINVASDGTLVIGALATLTAIATDQRVVSDWKALAVAAEKVGSPELRNSGTIGGNISQKPRCLYYRLDNNLFWCARKKGSPNNTCFANAKSHVSGVQGIHRYHSIFGQVGGCYAVCPSDTAPALIALKAKIVTTSGTHEAKDFFDIKSSNGDQMNILGDGELIKEIRIPKPAAGTKSIYRKFAFRKAIDFPLVSVAAVVTTSGGSVSAASIVLGGVAIAPRVAEEAESSISGKTINATNALAAGDAAVVPAANSKTTMPKAFYKAEVAKNLIARAIQDCA